MLNSDENRNEIIKLLPRLKGDSKFKIIKKECPDYNCFAWVAFYDNVFWTPLPHADRPTIHFDGVIKNWPFDVANDCKISTLIEIFRNLGYEECSDGSLEENYRKIVIYGKNDEGTHAARQLTKGRDKGAWTSKLGSSFLILHDVKSIEGVEYGEIKQYMRKRIK